MNNQSSTADRPLKRRRGRPRSFHSMQGADILKDKKRVVTSNPTSDDMIGQMVSGVIDGSFGAGYLLSVKVGDTNMHLRGAAFLPRQITPITPENDVAPYAEMIERKEIPFPVVNSEGHPHALSSSSGKSKKLVEHKNDAHNFRDQGLDIGLQSGATIASGSQSTSIAIPPASILPINDTDLSQGQKVLQEQILGSGLQTDKVVVQESLLMKGPNIIVAALNPSEPVSATLPVTETVNLKPQVEDQALCSDLETRGLFHDDVKSLDLGDNGIPKCSETEPQAKACGPAQINTLEKEASLTQDIDILDDTKLELAAKNSGGAGTSPMDGSSASDPATTAMSVPCSASVSNPNTELDLATKNSGGADTSHMDGLSASDTAEETPPKMVVPEDSSSLKAADTNSEKSNDKDDIRPAQS